MSADPSAPDANVRFAAAKLTNVREFSIFLEQQVGSRAASEDVLRDAFALGNRETPHAGEPIRAWFYRLLRNAVLEQPRHSLEGKLVAFRSELEQRIEPSGAVGAAIDRYVGVIAATLGPEHSELLGRVELAGEALGTYAELAGISPASAEERLSLARTELYRQVVSSFGTCSVHGAYNCTCGASLGDYGRGRSR
jgi:DNA-directed RNA polymerase specialized sigma24 family protein